MPKFNLQLGSVLPNVKRLAESACNKARELLQANQDIKGIEIELRINRIEGGIEKRTGITRTDFESYLKRLMGKYSNRRDVSTSIHTDKVYSKGDYRRIVSTNNSEICQLKKKMTSVDFQSVTGAFDQQNPTVTPMRLSLAYEQPISRATYDQESKTTFESYRHRKRYTFKFIGYQIDLSQVSYEKDTQYNIEVDLTGINWSSVLSQASDKAADALMKIVLDSLCDAISVLYPSLHTWWSYPVYQNLSQHMPAIYEGPRPVNIQEQHYNILATNQQEYYVTNKLDGTAYFLFYLRYEIDNVPTIQILLRNKTDCWNIARWTESHKDLKTKENESLIAANIVNRLVANVEIVEQQSASGLHVSVNFFDIVNPKVARFSQRINEMSTFNTAMTKLTQACNNANKSTKMTFAFARKSFFKGDPSLAAAVSKTVQNMASVATGSLSSIVDNNDGLIFQPEMCDDRSKRVYKWKFYSKVSVDFYLEFDKQVGNMCTYKLYVNDRSALVPFKILRDERQTSQTRQCVVKNPNEVQMLHVDCDKLFDHVTGKDLNGYIGECTGTYDATKQQIIWALHRIRWDKSYPNNKFVALETVPDICFELTLPNVLAGIDAALRRLKPSSQGLPAAAKTVDSTASREENKMFDLSDDQRNIYFPDANQARNLKMTTVGLYSIAKPKEADFITSHILSHVPNPTVVIDVTGGVGGSTLSMAKLLPENTTILTIENDHTNFAALAHNIQQYKQLEPYKRQTIVLAEGDSLELVSQLICNYKHADVIYMDHPWGGRSYKEQKDVDYTFSSKELAQAIKYLLNYTGTLVVRVGLNIALQRLLNRLKSFGFDVQKTDMKNAKNEVYSYLVTVTYTGLGFKKLRVYNNRMKQQIICDYCKNVAEVLDLGSGKGGDLFKYKENNVASLTCVEPNPQFVEELRERIKQNPDHFTEMKINVISSTVQKLPKTPSQQYQVVSMFFMLTFFFHSEALLDNLVNVIDEYLAPNGYLIGATMVATPSLKVKLLENDAKGISTANMSICQEAFSSDLWNNVITIDLKHTETATKQCEYLVDFNVFAQKLADKRIYLFDTYYPETAGLSTDEALLASCTVGFAFVKRKSDNPPYANRVPVPLGWTNSKGNDLWRVPTQGGGDCLFYTLLQATDEAVDNSLINFVYNALPYKRHEVAPTKMAAFRQCLQTSLSFDLYCKLSVSAADLRNPDAVGELRTLINEDSQFDQMVRDYQHYKEQFMSVIDSTKQHAILDVSSVQDIYNNFGSWLSSHNLVETFCNLVALLYAFNQLKIGTCGVYQSYEQMLTISELLQIHIMTFVMTPAYTDWTSIGDDQNNPTCGIANIDQEHFELVRHACTGRADL